MNLDKTLVLARMAALVVVGAVGSSVLSLKQAEAATGELAAARRSSSEQVRVSKRREAELAGKLARTSAKLYGLTRSLAELKGQPGCAASDLEGDAQTGDALAPPDEAETAEHTQHETEAVERAEALVGNAAGAGRWTAQDRDRFQELLVQVEGPERRRLQESVGKLLVEGKLVVDEGVVPL